MGGCGERRPVAYCADLLTHNLKVIGSNPIPATKKSRQVNDLAAFFFRPHFERGGVSTLCQQKPWRPVAARGS